uniref:Uncharacterized protein n=1 Tax=Anguilla anguilla TaxID=7936 RepID=A0A0E9SX83_ANGAN
MLTLQCEISSLKNPLIYLKVARVGRFLVCRSSPVYKLKPVLIFMRTD